MIKVSLSVIVFSLIVFLLCLAGGWLYTSSQPAIYEASARIWIQSKVPPQIIGQPTQNIYTPLTQYYNSPISTAADVMRSQLVISRAYVNLQKQLPPTQCPSLGAICSGVHVEASKDSDLLILRFRSPQREAVAPVVQAILDEFIKVNNAQSAGTATQSRISLEAELLNFKKKYELTSEKLRNFQNANQTVDLSSDIKSLLEHRSDLEAEIAKARRSLSEQKSKIAFLQSQLGLSPEEASISQKLAQDEVLRNLKEKVAEDQVSLVDAKTMFKEAHPRVRQLNKSIQRGKTAVEERIQALIARSGGHLSPNSAEITSYDPGRQELLANMVQARSEEIALETGLQSLLNMLASTNTKLKDTPNQQAQFTALQRAQQAASEELSEVESKLQSTKVLESVAYNSSNIQIIDRPETPTAPVSPNKESDLIISALLGLAGGTGTFIGMFFLDPCLRRSEDATEILSLPVVGWIDQLASNARNPLNVHNTMAMHRLHVNLTGLIKTGQKHIIVTSPNPGDGKTTVAAGLALSLAQSGTRVLLIDGNLINANLDRIFRVTRSPGLTNYIDGPDPKIISKLLRPVKKNLMFIPAGAQAASETTILVGNTFEKLLSDVQNLADIIIVDTPACSQSAASLALLDKAAHLVVVVRLGHSSKQGLKELASQLELRGFSSGSIVFADASEEDIPAAPPLDEPKMAGQMSGAW